MNVKIDYKKKLLFRYRLKCRLTIADCCAMINSRRINAAPLFKRKVSSFLADTLLANTEEVSANTREKYGILPSFDNYSGIECHAFIYFLSDISSLPAQEPREGHSSSSFALARAMFDNAFNQYQISLFSHRFQKRCIITFVMKAITICDKPDSYIRFIVEVFFLTVLSIDISFALSLLRDPEENSSSIFVRRIYFMKDVCSNNRSHEKEKVYIQIRSR